jgi:hypothetical protein
LVESPEGKGSLEDLGIYVKAVLKLILNKHVGQCGLDPSDTQYKPLLGFCESSHETLNSTTSWEFLDYLGTYWHLKKAVTLEL